MENKSNEEKEKEEATNLKKFFQDNIEDIAKRIIELYEFQENIKFVNTKFEYNPQ